VRAHGGDRHGQECGAVGQQQRSAERDATEGGEDEWPPTRSGRQDAQGDGRDGHTGEDGVGVDPPHRRRCQGDEGRRPACQRGTGDLGQGDDRRDRRDRRRGERQGDVPPPAVEPDATAEPQQQRQARRVGLQVHREALLPLDVGVEEGPRPAGLVDEREVSAVVGLDRPCRSRPTPPPHRAPAPTPQPWRRRRRGATATAATRASAPGRRRRRRRATPPRWRCPAATRPRRRAGRRRARAPPRRRPRHGSPTPARRRASRPRRP
jgi:hypothetical protein